MALQPSPAVVRAGEVLRHLAANPTQPFTVYEFARTSGVPRATWEPRLSGLPRSGIVRVNRWANEVARRRAYSVTLVTGRQEEFADALSRLVDQPDADEPRRRRDQALQALAHSDYLAADIDPDRPVRLTQVSAPVFDS